MQPEDKFKQIYNPKSNRLQKFDYSSNGGYFITICTKDRENYFGEIVDGKMMLNDSGKIVFEEIKNIGILRENVILDEFVIMPNHVHLIIMIHNVDKITVETSIYGVSNNNHATNPDTTHLDAINRVSTGGKGGMTGNKNIMFDKNDIGFIIRQFKGKSTFLIHKFCKDTIHRVSDMQFFAWQPNYYDRIIRDDDELQRIRKYIQENPVKMGELDKNNIENIFM